MNRFRRILSVVAAVLAGASGTLAVAAPAHADGPTTPFVVEVSGKYECLPNGTWRVDWLITNSNQIPATLVAVTLTPPGTTVTNIAVGAYSQLSNPLKGIQIVPGDEDSAGLAITAQWPAQEVMTDTDSHTMGFEGECEPTYTVGQDCNALTFTFQAPEITEVPTEAPTLTGASAGTRHVKLVPSVGTPVEFDLHAGDPDKVVTIAGSAGLTVDIYVDDFPKVTETFTHAPCPAPSLPVTGAGVSAPLGIGAGLVAVGTALIVGLFLLRRRRTVAGG